MMIFVYLLFANALMHFMLGEKKPTLTKQISQIVMIGLLIFILLKPILSGWSTSVNYQFYEIGNVQLSVTFMFDKLCWVMLIAVIFISFIIQSYAARYLLSDLNQNRFMAQLSLLTLAVILLICSGSLLTAFIAWQFIGLTLYLLLNHFHYDPKANKAAKKKFMINRLGDICFLFAVILFFKTYGTTDYQAIAAHNATLSVIPLLLILVAVMTKSAQFPFHIWLIDTMETPTPVSAMMHAGVINAGGYLLARLSFLYINHNGIMMFMLVIGLVTAVLGQFFKLYQADIKKQLAYSTMGQMGYMIVQCGLGCFASAIFHLIAHGIYKASLFLSAGTLTQQNPMMLQKKLQSKIITKVTVLIITLTLLLLGYDLIILMHAKNDLNLLLWFFMGVTLFQCLHAILQAYNQFIVKFLSIIILAGFYFFYLIAISYFINFINIPSSSSLLSILIGAIVLISFILSFYFIKPNDLNKVGLNKLNIEFLYRKYMINPLRFAGDFLLNGFNKLPYIFKMIIVGLLVIPQLFILYQLAVLKLPIAYNLSVFYISYGLIVLTILGIVANRAKKLIHLLYLLILSSLVLTAITFSLDSQLMDTIGFYFFINAFILIVGITFLLIKRQSSQWLITPRENKLPICHFYLSCFLLCFIGIPGTSSFISELFLFNALLNMHVLFAVITGAYMILLTLIILHTLQTSIFNPEAIHKNIVSLSWHEHILLLAILIFNLFNGMFPNWLLSQLSYKA